MNNDQNNIVPFQDGAHEVSEAERIARDNLQKKSPLYRKIIEDTHEIVSFEDNISQLDNFKTIFSVDASAAKFDTNKGNILKAAFCAVGAGGITNINNIKTLKLYGYTALQYDFQNEEIIKSLMNDKEYEAIQKLSSSTNESDMVTIKDGAVGSIAFDVERMISLNGDFETIKNNKIIENYSKSAENGELVSSVKKINNSKSEIIQILSKEDPHIPTLNDKEVMSNILNGNEYVILKTNGEDMLPTSYTGINRLVNHFKIDPQVIGSYLNLRELITDNYVAIFAKFNNNPHPIKFEFLNKTMLQNWEFFKGIDLEMKGYTVVPIPQVKADLEAKRGRWYSKAHYKIRENKGKSSAELINGVAMPFRN